VLRRSAPGAAPFQRASLQVRCLSSITHSDEEFLQLNKTSIKILALSAEGCAAARVFDADIVGNNSAHVRAPRGQATFEDGETEADAGCGTDEGGGGDQQLKWHGLSNSGLLACSLRQLLD
jgi:hypothetical protein